MNYQPPEWVNQYIGTEFVDKGRTPEEGFDCWGLCRWVWNEHFNITVPSYLNSYTSCDKGADVDKAVEQGLEEEWSSVSEANVGDGIVFRLAGKMRHIGVVVSHTKMLHVFRGINVCLERYKGPRWRDRIAGIYRHDSLLEGSS